VKKILLNYIEKFKSSAFAKNVAMIAGATLFAQTLSIIISPILTRLYTPEDYGVLALFNSFIIIFSVIGSLNYHKAIPIADNDCQASNILFLCLIILVVLVFSVAVFLTLFDSVIFKLFNSSKLSEYKYLIPISILLVCAYSVFQHWAYRKRNYKLITKTSFQQSIIGSAAKLLLGFFNTGALGLILGTVASQSVGIVSLITPYLRTNRLRYEKKEIISNIKRYSKFPIFTTPGELLYVLSSQLPIFFISALYDVQTVGCFGFANTILGLPLSLLGISIGQVFYAEAANIGKNNPIKLKKEINKLVIASSVAGLVPLLVVIIFGEDLFALIFGEKWREAGVYARILSILAYVSFIVMPIGRVLEIIEKQKEALIMHVARLIFLIAVFMISDFLLISSLSTVVLYVAAMSFISLIGLMVLNILINNEIRRHVRL